MPGTSLSTRADVADDERADGRTKDDDELVGLPQDLQVATHLRVAAEDASEDDQCADEQPHNLPSLRGGRAARTIATNKLANLRFG